MSLSDCKLFIIIGVIALAAYLLFLSPVNTMFSNMDGEIDFDRDKPTIQFVPEGTPGAITWEEYKEQRHPRSDR